MDLYFYTTPGCHLCEDALEFWIDQANPNWELVAVDIAQDDQLIELYGEKIPVFKRSDNNVEICWPFGIH